MQKIECEICEQEITQPTREELIGKREYKEDVVISRDAYWNDMGIVSLIRTRRFYHKKCFEEMLGEEIDRRRWVKMMMKK